MEADAQSRKTVLEASATCRLMIEQKNDGMADPNRRSRDSTISAWTVWRESFYAKPFLKAHPEYDWYAPILRDMPAYPWTTFTSDDHAKR